MFSAYTVCVASPTPRHCDLHGGVDTQWASREYCWGWHTTCGRLYATMPPITPLLPTCLLGLSSRSGVYFLFPWIWDGFVTCFDQENGTEVALHQALKSSETCTFTLLGALGHHEKESIYSVGQRPYGEKQAWHCLAIPATPAGAADRWLKPSEIPQPRWAGPANTIWSRDELSHRASPKLENCGQKYGCCFFLSD